MHSGSETDLTTTGDTNNVDQKRRLDYILRGTNVGTWEWNVQTGETIFNERWAEMIGYSLSELAPVSLDTWIEHCHPDDLAKSGELLQECFEQKSEYYNYECRMRHKNGEWIWVLDRGKVATWTEDGQPEWMYGTHQEITSRKHAEESLRKHNELLDIISRMSTQFINLPQQEIDEGIHTALARIGKYVGVDRAYIFRITDDATQMNNTHEWCAHGTASQLNVLQGLPTKAFPWWIQNLREFKTIHIPWAKELPTEATAEKALLKKHQIKSLVVAPLVYQKKLTGFIGFDAMRSEMSWSEKTIDLLRLVGDIIISALIRQRTEERLRSNEENFRNFFATMDDMVFVADQLGNIFYTNDAARRQLGYEKETLHQMHMLDLYPLSQKDDASKIFTDMYAGRRESCPIPMRHCCGFAGLPSCTGRSAVHWRLPGGFIPQRM